MRARSLRLLLMSLCLLMGAHAHAALVAVVLSETRGAYQEFADGLRADMRKEAPSQDVLVMDVDQAAARGLSDVQLVIAVGGKAMESVLSREQKPPVLVTLVPRSSFDKLPTARREDRRVSALFIDQPPMRYIDLVRTALPDLQHLGMLVGRDSRDHIAQLAQAARERKLRPTSESIASEVELYPALQKMFGDGNGALLATPDTSVFNTQTIPNIILSTYRFRVPVIGFSPAYVRSGALIAIYSTPAHLAVQSSEIARNVLNGAALPAPQYPRLFSVGINSVVARGLGLELDSEQVIHDRIEKLERP